MAVTVAMTVVGDPAFSGELAADPVRLVSGLEPGVRQLLAAEIVVGNQECVISDDIPADAKGPGAFPLLTGTATVGALRLLGVDVVLLANSHIRDFGAGGLESTMEALAAGGIAHLGAATNRTEALRMGAVELLCPCAPGPQGRTASRGPLPESSA